MSSLISLVESSLTNVTWRVFGFGEDLDFAVKKPTIPEGRTIRSQIVPRSRSRSQSRDEGNGRGRDIVSKRRLAQVTTASFTIAAGKCPAEDVAA